MTIRDESMKSSRAVPVTVSTLVERVQALQAGREQPVVINADKSARYEDVIGILDRLQLGGIEEGRIARAADACVAQWNAGADLRARSTTALDTRARQMDGAAAGARP